MKRGKDLKLDTLKQNEAIAKGINSACWSINLLQSPQRGLGPRCECPVPYRQGVSQASVTGTDGGVLTGQGSLPGVSVAMLPSTEAPQPLDPEMV